MRFVMKFLLPLLGLLASSGVEARDIGMVLDARGTVSAESAGKSRPLEITDTFDTGTRITVNAGGEVTFVFYPTREEYTTGGPAVLRVEAESVKAEQGSSLKVKKLPQQKTQVAQGYLGRVVPAALVMKGLPGHESPPDAIYPADGETVLETRPEFEWSASMDSISMVLQEKDDKLLERTVEGTRLSLPRDLSLVPGHRYLWTVQAGKRTAIAHFNVATTLQRQRLAALKPASSASPADWTVYAMALAQAGATREARKAWGRVAELRPDSETVKDLSQ